MKIFYLVASLITSAIMLVVAYVAYHGATVEYDANRKIVLSLLAFGLPILMVVFTVQAIKDFLSKP